ncbi:hypothetical protein [Polaribacter sp. KT 15]|uniref:hypothetical protein n=1 Tax=Polaribacter sp. KT 15 TaxID=1896175 RepID=UPI00090CA41E|nr:hypothetical protein [Polaribacter sp. KT 15]SHN09632.1 hypothetical protein SAMN05720268_2879 [Polaribacter sp. KT 15]
MFKSDILKYKKYSGGKSSLILLLTTQGLWAIFVYRVSNYIFKSNLSGLIKKPCLLLALIFQKWIEIITGISIPYTFTIDHSFYIGHFVRVIINTKAIIACKIKPFNEFTGNSDSILFFKPNSKEYISKKVVDLLSDHKKRLELIEESQKHTLESFNSHNILEDNISFYNPILR